VSPNIKMAAIALAVVQAAILLVLWLDVPMILTSWASSAALIGGLRASPAARPLAVSGGHIISGLVGLGALMIAKQGLPFDPRWLIAPAVGVAVLLMAATRLLHPPAAANPAITLVVPTDPISFAIALFAGAALLALLTFLLDRVDDAGKAQESMNHGAV
jgi:CBS-domain-containing membrane protein